jgi:hypothetical protein
MKGIAGRLSRQLALTTLLSRGFLGGLGKVDSGAAIPAVDAQCSLKNLSVYVVYRCVGDSSAQCAALATRSARTDRRKGGPRIWTTRVPSVRLWHGATIPKWPYCDSRLSYKREDPQPRSCLMRARLPG